MKHTIDEDKGGFYGKIDADDKVVPGAPKGLVFNSRMSHRQKQ
jgi:mannobiose 2-epimerase